MHAYADLVRLANLALKFLLELAAFAAYGWAAYTLIGHPVLSWVGVIGVVLVVATIWGIFIAPNSTRKLPVRSRIVLELAIFAVAAFLLTLAGAPLAAVILAALVAVNELLLIRWGQYVDVDAAAERRRQTATTQR